METLKQAFAIDYRSLRLFRILLGLGLVFESISLSFAAHDFLSDAGVYPRSLLYTDRFGMELLFPLNLYGGVWWAFVWIFLLAALGVFIVADRFPRLNSLIAYCTLTFLIARNPYIFYGSDKLLQAICFWSIFLPAGRRTGETEKTFSTGVSFSVLMQIAVVYAAAGFAKSTYFWWTHPVASYLALQGDAYARDFGKFLTAYPDFLELGTRLVWVLERAGWILLFIPWRNGILRICIIVAFSLMHVAFGLGLSLQLFPYFDIVLLSIALPSLFWDRLGKVPAYLQSRFLSEPARSLRGVWTACSEPLAMLALGFTIWVVVHTLPGKPVKLPPHIERIMQITGFHQSWDLFAPYPYLDDGWYVFIGRTQSGQEIDLLTGGERPILFEHPGNVVARNPNYRWTAYLFQMRHPNKTVDMRMAQFMCETRRDPAGLPLKEVDVFYVDDPTMEPGFENTPSVSKRLNLPCAARTEASVTGQASSSP